MTRAGTAKNLVFWRLSIAVAARFCAPRKTPISDALKTNRNTRRPILSVMRKAGPCEARTLAIMGYVKTIAMARVFREYGVPAKAFVSLPRHLRARL